MVKLSEDVHISFEHEDSISRSPERIETPKPQEQSTVRSDPIDGSHGQCVIDLRQNDVPHGIRCALLCGD